jgi:exosome complex component RRP41
MNDYEGEIVLAAIEELKARMAQMEVKQQALEVYINMSEEELQAEEEAVEEEEAEEEAVEEVAEEAAEDAEEEADEEDAEEEE